MRVAALLVVLAIALAGCSGNDDDTPNEPGTPGEPDEPGTPGNPEPTKPVEPITQIAMLSNYDFVGCDGLRYIWSGSPDEVNAILPDGYTATTFAGVAQVVAELYQCSEFTASGALFEDVWLGRVSTHVVQPEAFPNSTADSHQYIFTMLGGSDILSALWPAAGFEMHNGSTSFEDLGGGGLWAASAGEYVWTAATPTPPAGLGSNQFAWYHETQDGGTLVWNGTANQGQAQAGAGSMEYPSDGVFGSLTGGGNGLMEAGAAVSYSEQYLVLHLPDQP